MLFDRSNLDTFPTQPGVYLMKDADGHILYVGKAKNVRQRVRQYFLAGGDGRAIIPFLVAKIAKIDVIVVNSEKEALLLENTLIKQHKPRYNALLKDDKTYIALKLTHKHRWPMLALVRYKDRPKPGALYFGPYTSADSARKTFDLLNSLFPLRQCSDQEFARRTRPCILYDMKRCIAPCVQRCTKEEYDRYVDKTIKFLKGQDKEVLHELYAEMHRAADALEFEKAAAVLKTIRQIETTLEGQKVDKPLGIDIDALGLYRQGDEVIVTQLLFRGGRLVGSHNYNFAHIVEEDAELLEAFICQRYDNHPELPHEILLPTLPEDIKALEEVLSAQPGRRQVKVFVPQKGEKKALLEMAQANAAATFKKEKDVAVMRQKVLLEMQERFHLARYPKRIECFDNSNTAGSLVVSSLVAFTDGVKDSARYRKYKIKTAAGSDDYAAMGEAIERRYKRAKEENDLPDLLIIDGGKGHLNAALKVLAKLDIVSMDVIGVAKEEGRHDKGVTSEQVFLPNVKDPILLKRHSPVLFLLQQIRDEAHRFVITYHRKLRSKKDLKSVLEDIPGIGITKRTKLLRHFGSAKKVLMATEEQLLAVQGISQADARAIVAYGRQQSPS